jgi:ATP synthase I subunit
MIPDVQTDPGDQFFSAAIDRIRRITVVLGIASTVVVWAIYGTAVGIGFLIGCVISYINFHWLKKAIDTLASRITLTGQITSSRGTVLRFMLRYGFIVIACYVILIGSKSSVYGLLGGLFVTVAAILCEAAYEVAVALRRGI